MMQIRESERYLKSAGNYERAGELDKALHSLILASKDPERSTMRRTIDENIRRIIARAARIAGEAMSEILPIYEHERNPRNYNISFGANDSETPCPVVSLTSISTRIARIEATVRSILTQTVVPHSINLYVSDEPYLIDEGVSAKDPILRKIADLGVNIYQVKNIGPYRKQYPVISQLRNAGAVESTPIITIDDDVIYPSNIVERLISGFSSGDAVVAHRGREIALTGPLFSDYKSFPAPSRTVSLLNMGTGKNGIAYRLRHFPKELEYYVGHVLAPTADDIWCKWVTAMYCVPTLILEPQAAYDPTLDFKESAPEDKNGLFHKYNAKGTNDIAMGNLETFFSHRGHSVLGLYNKDQNV